MKINFEIDYIVEFLKKYSRYSDSVYWLSSPDFKKIYFISPAYETIWLRNRELLYEEP